MDPCRVSARIVCPECCTVPEKHSVHATGALVIERVGHLINQHLNRQDIGVWWGGEEFLLIFLDTDLDAAQQAAEAFRKLIARLRFHDEIRVTGSFGVAQYRPGKESVQLFQRADDALYTAKKQGRNRVCASASQDEHASSEFSPLSGPGGR